MYKPERPSEIKELITNHTKDNLPHFFKYAKDKNDDQVVDVNGSFVNKLNKFVPNPRINCRKLGLGKIDYTLLMDNPDINCKVAFTEKGKMIKESTDPLIVKYCELNKQHRFVLDSAMRIDKTFSVDTVRKSQFKHDLKYKNAINGIKDELSQFDYADEEIADILVKFLYGIKDSKHKIALWLCYGDIIFSNLEKNVKRQTKEIQCVDCGEWFEVGIFDSATCRCEECKIEHDKYLNRIASKERMRRYRERKKNNVTPTL